ncbi:MAG: hypothetical protein J7K40_12895 [candidate division Zixibacteria bacterium]|nr:hypothetical protein [candidate division Zixibacteria bacterium]
MKSNNLKYQFQAKKKAIILLALYLFTTIFILSLIKSPGLVNERAGMINMTDFKAYKPFQYRILLPCLIRTIEFMTPEPIKNKIDSKVSILIHNKFKHSENESFDSKTNMLSQNGYRIIVYLILNALALLMFLFILRQLALALGMFSERTCDLLPLGMAVAIPIYFNYGNFMYDFAHLCLFTLALLLLYKKQWQCYLIAFLFALLNKETSVMLIIVFAVNYYSELPRSKFVKLLSLQALIFIAVKFSLYIVFKNNPGGLVEWHLIRNLEHLSKLSSYFNFEHINTNKILPLYPNIPLPRGLNLLMFIFIALGLFYKWREKPVFLKKSLIYAALLLIMCIFMGHIDELRSYYAALPVVYLLCMHSVVEFINNMASKSERV